MNTMNTPLCDFAATTSDADCPQAPAVVSTWTTESGRGLHGWACATHYAEHRNQIDGDSETVDRLRPMPLDEAVGLVVADAREAADDATISPAEAVASVRLDDETAADVALLTTQRRHAQAEACRRIFVATPDELAAVDGLANLPLEARHPADALAARRGLNTALLHLPAVEVLVREWTASTATSAETGDIERVRAAAEVQILEAIQALTAAHRALAAHAPIRD